MIRIYIIIIMMLILNGCASNAVFKDSDIPVKAKPFYILSDDSHAVTVWGTIFIPSTRIQDFLQQPLPVTREADLIHERVHARRQHSYGMLMWHLSYLVSPNFRWAEEKVAYEAEITHLRNNGYIINRDKIIIAVTDPYYHGMITREEAAKWIDNLLKQPMGAPPVAR